MQIGCSFSDVSGTTNVAGTTEDIKQSGLSLSDVASTTNVGDTT